MNTFHLKLYGDNADIVQTWQSCMWSVGLVFYEGQWGSLVSPPRRLVPHFRKLGTLLVFTLA